MAAVGAAAAERGGHGRAVDGASPIALLLTGFGDDAGQPAADAQFGGVIERQHRRGVAVSNDAATATCFGG